MVSAGRDITKLLFTQFSGDIGTGITLLKAIWQYSLGDGNSSPEPSPKEIKSRGNKVAKTWK